MMGTIAGWTPHCGYYAGIAAAAGGDDAVGFVSDDLTPRQALKTRDSDAQPYSQD